MQFNSVWGLPLTFGQLERSPAAFLENTSAIIVHCEIDLRLYAATSNVTLEMSTPVTPFTISGIHFMMVSTSPVSLAAPTWLSPQETMVTLRACDNGAATSAAIYKITSL